jgi:methylthioribose-1-phosphate isomerase
LGIDTVRALAWNEGHLVLLDQRLLPQRREHLHLDRAASVALAIRDLVVRGAPAIGIAAAYAVVLAARAAYQALGPRWTEAMQTELEALRAARPTAVNLAWALQRMQSVFPAGVGDPEPALLREARMIHEEDLAANHRMGAIGVGFLKSGARVLTHCNAGSLATGGFGTALGVVRAGYAAGRIARVYVGETRPWLQGARLSAWELTEDGVPVTLLVDSAAAYLMQGGGVDWVIVGADRIAASGDVANKIGTYGLALAARRHGVRFMVVAPSSTFDSRSADGKAIPIEIRESTELLACGGLPIAAAGTDAWNPVFDITPAELVDVLVTERGAIEHPDTAKLRDLFAPQPPGGPYRPESK